MDDPSNWRGDQDIVDLASWRAAGFGEFEDDDVSESKPPKIKEEDGGLEERFSGSSLRLKIPENMV